LLGERCNPHCQLLLDGGRCSRAVEKNCRHGLEA
jgi:hypothetical protein